MNVKNETPAGELSDEQILEIFSAPPHLRKTLTAAARAVIAADRALRPAASAPTGWQLVPVDFLRGFCMLAHNYSLVADAPDYYHGTERDAFGAAYARCGLDLGNLRAMLAAAAPKPPAAVTPAGDAIKELVEDYANEMACEPTSATDSGPDIEAARRKLYAAIDALTGSPSVVATAGDVVMTMKTQLEGEIKPVRQTDAQAALAAKDADYAHGVALLNMRIKDLTAERDRLRLSHAELLKSTRKAVLALSHVMIDSKMRQLYEGDYNALSAAIAKAASQEGGAA